MTLQEIKTLLREHDAYPKKGLGQNFLFEQRIIKKMVDAAQIRPDDFILEIGPGVGNLTVGLAKGAKHILAVEKDPRMVETLTAVLSCGDLISANSANKVEVVNGDVLRFDEAKLPAGYKVVANLPFYLTAPAIRKFLESQNPPQTMVLIIQKEVAQRIVAKPPKMSLLAVSVQFYAAAKIVCYIPKNCFWPSPKVDCAIIEITPRKNNFDKNFAEKFFKIVKAGFSHPRKQLANNLSKELKMDREATELWLTKSGIASTRRAETLMIEDWQKLLRFSQMR